MLAEEIEHLKAQLESEHTAFGDRHNKLTLKGLKAARESFAATQSTRSVLTKRSPPDKAARPSPILARSPFDVSIDLSANAKRSIRGLFGWHVVTTWL